MGIFFHCRQRELEKKIRNILIIQVITSVAMKIDVLWNVTPCGMLDRDRHFEGSLHFHGRKVIFPGKEG
jgi:hypothetical protein